MIYINTGASQMGWSIWNNLSCMRKLAFAIQHKKEGIGLWEGSEATFKGTMMHVLLAHHYAQQLNDAQSYMPPEKALNHLRSSLTSVKEQEWYDTNHDMVLNVYNQYITEGDPLWSYTVLEVEKEWRSMQHKGLVYSGRADLLVKHRGTGELWLVDHKTSSREVSDISQAYRYDGQFVGLAHLLRVSGTPVMGVICNSIRWPLKTSGPKFSFDPIYIGLHTERLLQASVREAWGCYEEDKTPMEYPPNITQCMGRYNTTCPFLSYCHG